MPNETSGGDDLESRIRRWLSSQGYPLELEAVQQFSEAQFQVHASRTYLDNESGSSTWREIDLLASRTLDLDTKYFARVVFCVECKTSDKPWLLFRHPRGRLAEPARVVQRFANHGGRRILHDMVRELAGVVDLFDVAQPQGHSITVAFTTGRDVAWEACFAASKAAAYQASLNGQGMLLVALPLIVIDSPLYYCQLSTDGQIALERTEEGDLVWARSFESPNTIIKVITKEGLPRIIPRLRSEADDFLRALGGNKDRIFAILENSSSVGRRASSKNQEQVSDSSQPVLSNLQAPESD
jgi:hypothetical protein